jgi:hypothetical protein
LLAAYTRVKLSGGNLVQAGASDAFVEIGTVDEDVFNTLLEAGQPQSVRLRGMPGTRKMIAAGAFSAGPIYAAAYGEVTATPSGPAIGISLESPGAAAQVIECIYQPPLPIHLVDLTDVTALNPAQGSVPYFGASGALAVLAPTTSGYVLETQGAAANPIFANPA